MVLERLVLHIGTHKTGTTAIQTALVQASPTLEEHGVLYPTTGRISDGGHLNLAWETSNDPRFQVRRGGYRELLAEIGKKRPSLVILSAETFSTFPEDQRHSLWALRLQEDLRPQKVEVLAYVRPQWEYLDSLYPQRVKTGTVTRRFGSFVGTEKRKPLFEYRTLFEHWHVRFPGGLVIRPYRRSMLNSGDVVADFWRVAELDSVPPPALTRDFNPRLGARATEILRVLASMLNASEARLSNPQRWRLFKDATERAQRAFTNDPPFRGMDYITAQALHDYFTPGNAWLADELLSTDAEQLFRLTSPEDWPPLTSWDIRDALPEEARLVLEVCSKSIHQSCRRGVQKSYM